MTNAFNLHAGQVGPALDRLAAGAEAIESAAAPLSDGIDASPFVLLALTLGLALWLVGDRLFRPAASLLGAIVGAGIGFTISAAWSGGGEAAAPYAIIGACALLGLAVGALMYRLAVGLSGGLVLAGLAAGIAAVASIATPLNAPPERPETIAEAQTWSGTTVEARITRAANRSDASLESLTSMTRSAGNLLHDGWLDLPPGARNLIAAAAIAGCVAGMVFGGLRPRVAGPMIAALAGAGLWLGATTLLLGNAGRPMPPMPTEAPVGWLGAWLAVAMVGFMAQRRVFPQLLTSPVKD